MAASTSAPSPAPAARGKTPEEDDALAAELLADPKERAEHLMLVDLARNDVGRVAEYGSVQVDDFMIVERYSHVMHIVSNVDGELAPTAQRLRRDARHLSRRHRQRRAEGPRHADHQLAARKTSAAPTPARSVTSASTASTTPASPCAPVVLKDGKAYVQAGAGVVADSEPDLRIPGNRQQGQGHAPRHRPRQDDGRME